MATQIAKTKRGIFGKICISVFWIFQILMVLWIWAGISGNSEQGHLDSTAGQVGTGIGVALIVIVWLVGTVIFGVIAMLTKGKTVIETID